MTISPLIKLERRIARGEQAPVIDRWHYGRQVLESRVGRQRLPQGMIADLVAAAVKAGFKVTEREIQYRISFAEAYETITVAERAVRLFGSWTALRDAGFPAMEADPDDPEVIELAEPADEWEQLTLIPGLKPVLSIRGRKVPLEEASIADVAEYHDMFAAMHESFGKTLALIEASLEAMRDGSDDDTANAVEAYKRGTGEEVSA